MVTEVIEAEGGMTSRAVIEERLDLHSASVSSTLWEMEKKGLLEKEFAAASFSGGANVRLIKS